MPSYDFDVRDAAGETRRFVVGFPYEAYDCQLIFMRRALEAMCGRASALLESPTGTGKTLCLLAATLAFAREEQRRGGSGLKEDALNAKRTTTVKEDGLNADEGDEREGKRRKRSQPVVIYATRTHSQVNQVVRELKLLDPSTEATTLASRQHLCVHPKIKELKGNAQKNACANVVLERKCLPKLELDGRMKPGLDAENAAPSARGEVQDIEDLVRAGAKGPCPFYMARARCSNSEIILMPYNYLLDDSVRRGLDIDWADAIVVVDEAHNLESSASDSMSYTLTAGKLAKAVDEANTAYETKLTFDDTSEEGIVNEQDRELMKKGLENEEATFTANDFRVLAENLVRLEDIIQSIAIKAGEKQPKGGLGEQIGDGGFIYQILSQLNITAGTFKHFTSLMKCAAKTVVYGGSVMKNVGQNGDTPLADLAKFIDRLFMRRAEEHFVTRIGPEIDKFSSGKTRQGASLSYWCFFPGLPLKVLIDMEVKTFLLASGTLSPMQSFASELALDFPVRLENSHVISQSQIWGGVVAKGPGDKTLNSSYRFRDTVEYKSEIGAVVSQVARAVPDGLLVFFPSYGVMDSCIQHWKATRVWQDLESSKACFIEPKNTEEFRSVYDAYNKALSGGVRTGAAFFAVCRGKVSEGIDFSDKACRGVILTGIPYAGATDPLVKNKRAFLDKRKAKSGDGYSGSEWYSQTAMRAVNQALGRVIRHKNDFGAVILADERFAHESSRNQLSLWLRPSIQNHVDFSSAIRGLREFFRNHATSTKLVRAEPAKLVDFVAVKSKTLGKEKREKREKTKANTSGSCVASLVRQFTRDQKEEEAKVDEAIANRQFMLVSKRSVPLQSSIASHDSALNRRAKAAMRKSSLLDELSKSNASSQQSNGESDQNVEPTNRKLFMRRARMELSREAYEELDSELEKIKRDDFDIGNLLRVASRVLKAPENPKGLYSLFGEFVPIEHKPIYEQHRTKLMERQAQKKAERAAKEEGHVMPVASAPRVCVRCAEPCVKPFEASGCKHVACYACWLTIVKPKGPGACPCCKREVLKRHLVKKFF